MGRGGVGRTTESQNTTDFSTWSTLQVREATKQRIEKRKQGAAAARNTKPEPPSAAETEQSRLADDLECVPRAAQPARRSSLANTRSLASESGRSASDAEQSEIGGEDLHVVPLAAPKPTSASVPPSAASSRRRALQLHEARSAPPAPRSCQLFPAFEPPEWLTWLPLLSTPDPPAASRPGSRPPSRPASTTSGPPSAASSFNTTPHRPHFRELKDPTPGWLEVKRAPADFTRLDLSPDSGYKGVPKDATLFSLARKACATLTHLNVSGCTEISCEAVIDVARANPNLHTVKATCGKPWAAGAVTQLLEAASEIEWVELDLACRRLDSSTWSLLDRPEIRPRSLTVLNRTAGDTVEQDLGPLLGPGRSQLRRLNLNGTRCGPKAARGLERALRPPPPPKPGGDMQPPSCLVYLNLGRCALKAEGAKDIGDMLRVNRVLRGLDLTQNTMGDEGVELVLNALIPKKGGNDTLKQLWISGNRFGTQGGTALAACLGSNKVLELMAVADCEMGPVAGRMVADAMHRNWVLQQLELQGNMFGDSVGRAFARMLEEHTQKSERKWEEDPDDGARYHIWKGPVLWRCELHNNELSPETAYAISRLTLKQLLKGHGGFNWKRAEAFDAGGDEEEEEEDSDDESDGGLSALRSDV